MVAATLPHVRPVALLVGQDRQETPTRHLARGLRDAGWEVDVVDSENSLAAGRTLLARVSAKLSEAAFERILAAEIERRAAHLAADLILFVKVIPLGRRALARLKRAGVRVALWYPDVSFAHPGVPRTFYDLVDAVVTTKSYHLPHLKQLRPNLPVALIHHGYCEDVHYPLRSGEPVFDVAYVGNASPAKRAAIEALYRARPRLRLAVSGNGWGTDVAWLQFGPLVGEQMSRFLGATKIALGLHYGPHGSEGWEDAVSARTFEIPACGAFMLHPDSPEVRTLYDADAEIEVFGDHASLVEQVDRWLASDQGRDRVAARAQRRACPAYGYRARGKEIAAFLDRIGLGART